MPKLEEEILQELFQRRGAAYGLAGIISGTGIFGIKEFDVIKRLHSAMEERRAFEPRHGAIFAMETMSATLGKQ